MLIALPLACQEATPTVEEIFATTGADETVGPFASILAMAEAPDSDIRVAGSSVAALDP